MGLSMIGLIAYQLYWINGLVAANEERFKKDVIEALNNVAGKLEKQETIAALNELQLLNSGPGKQKEHYPTSKYPSLSNSMEKPHQVVREQYQQSYMFQDTVEIAQNFQILISGSYSEYFFSNGVQGAAQEEIQQKDEEILALESQLARISRKYEMTLGVVEDLMSPHKPLAARFNPAQLDSLLATELKNKGIDIEYNYGVVSPSKQLFIAMSDRDGLEESDLRASLFPNDVFDNDGTIVIDFPEKQRFLIGKIWSSLISSGFLVAVILFCFGYSIRTIVHQKKLSEMKNDFINNMTHELKTPISTVSLAVEALSDKDIEGSSLRERYLKVINEENKRLGDQVEKVLQIAAIDRQDYNLKEELLMMNEIVKDATDHIAIQVEQRGGRLNLINNAAADYVKGDKTHLTNIVLNLLENANKYSQEAPHITLRTESKDDSFYLTVQDKGIGMNREQQKHIFQKFYRVPTGDVHDVKGFGLGLAYVQNMVIAHGGKIDVESEPGKGSKFLITLPLTNEA